MMMYVLVTYLENKYLGIFKTRSEAEYFARTFCKHLATDIIEQELI